MDTVLGAGTPHDNPQGQVRPGHHTGMYAVKNAPSLPTLALAILLCFLQTGLLTACGGCSARHEETGDKQAASAKTDPRPASAQTPAASARPSAPVVLSGDTAVLPRQTTLTQDAEISAAYLTLMQAISHEDEASAVAAAEILSRGKGELAMPSSYWIEGALWFMERKSVNAIPFLRAACRALPDDLPLSLLYAEALSDHNFGQEALAVLDAFLAKQPGNPEVLMQKGIVLFKEKKNAEAISVFESIGKFERSGFVEFYLARALMNLGRDEEALVHVRKAVKQLPDFEEALSLQAYLCERTDNTREAIQAYDKLSASPYVPKDVFLRLVNLCLRLNEPTRALEYYQRGPKDDTAFQLLAASLFTEFRHYLQAERILKDIAGRKDAPMAVFLFLADLTYEQRRDLEASLAWLERISDNSDFAQKKYLLRAQLEARASQYESSLATIDKAGRLFAPTPEFVTLKARVLANMGKASEAMATAKEGLAKWPDSTDMAFMLGSLLAENDQKDEALKVMEGIIEKDNSNYLALNYVGYSLADANVQLDRAITLLTRANTIAPNQFFILDSLAWAHFRAGNLDLAWKYIREAVRLDKSGDAEILEHYGDIALARGQRSEAREAYRKALANSADKKSLQQKIDSLK